MTIGTGGYLLLLGCVPSPKPVGDTATTVESHPPADSDTATPGDSGTTYVDPWDVDDDGDGYTENDGDCNDGHLSVHPGAEEDCETWADDDCDGYGECVGTAFFYRFGEFRWDSSGVVVGSLGAHVTGTHGDLDCSYGGDLVEDAASPAPACPTCTWTFHAEAHLANRWFSETCELIGVEDTGDVFVGSVSRPWGHAYTDPETGGSSESGWIVRNWSYADSGWASYAGPGVEYRDYAFTRDSGSASLGWQNTFYTDYMRYDRYGPPIRGYND